MAWLRLRKLIVLVILVVFVVEGVIIVTVRSKKGRTTMVFRIRRSTIMIMIVITIMIVIVIVAKEHVSNATWHFGVETKRGCLGGGRHIATAIIGMSRFSRRRFRRGAGRVDKDGKERRRRRC